ncbi:MAG TPA: ThiF family adenylyltransferase [Flavobacteriales bacterium]|jgi:adenylyltransferase/sulfurtransferase|nr:ThiF family adenylyltransferase [Flavobacteriales bacterium]
MSANAPAKGTARIAMIGAGGLGCAVLPRLARMRIALLDVVDGDRVEAHNLERQPLYEGMDIGHPKASTAAMWMRQILVAGQVRAHDVFLDANNAADLLREHDVVVEGVDDLHAKGLIDRTCAELGIPLVSGGVHRAHGQVLVLHAPGEGTALSRAELFTGKPGMEQDACDMREVPLAVLEETGRQMAQRVHDLLHGKPVPNGRIELYDGKRRIWDAVSLT